MIPKSAVGTLSSNSSNVINLIIDAYNVSQTAPCSPNICLSATFELTDHIWTQSDTCVLTMSRLFTLFLDSLCRLR